MTLIEEAQRAYEAQHARHRRQEEEFNQQVRLALKSRCFDVLTKRIDLDDIDDELFVTIDELRFSVIPTDPIMSAPLGLLLSCSLCETQAVFPIGGMAMLGEILHFREQGQVFCESCALLRQESFEPPEGTPRAKTSLETFVEALQSVLVDYSLGGASMLEDLRALLGERHANSTP